MIFGLPENKDEGQLAIDSVECSYLGYTRYHFTMTGYRCLGNIKTVPKRDELQIISVHKFGIGDWNLADIRRRDTCL